MSSIALGMIETYGYVGALAGADAAVKAAQVSIDRMEFIKGGIVTVFVVGDVGAVKAAVEAGETEAKRIGHFRRSHVIARVADEVAQLLTPVSKTDEAPVSQADEAPVCEPVASEAVVEMPLAPEMPVFIEAKPVEARPMSSPIKRSREELSRMKVVKLRNIARGIEGISIDRNRIKFSNKEELITAILAAYERRESQ